MAPRYSLAGAIATSLAGSDGKPKVPHARRHSLPTSRRSRQRPCAPALRVNVSLNIPSASGFAARTLMCRTYSARVNASGVYSTNALCSIVQLGLCTSSASARSLTARARAAVATSFVLLSITGSAARGALLWLACKRPANLSAATSNYMPGGRVVFLWRKQAGATHCTMRIRAGVNFDRCDADREPIVTVLHINEYSYRNRCCSILVVSRVR